MTHRSPFVLSDALSLFGVGISASVDVCVTTVCCLASHPVHAVGYRVDAEAEVPSAEIPELLKALCTRTLRLKQRLFMTLLLKTHESIATGIKSGRGSTGQGT